jgi:cell volume regulation protein A
MWFDYVLLIAGFLLLISVISSKASGRLGMPALLLFLVIGMLAGSEGIGGIYFDDVGLAQSLSVVALVFILFSGGFDTVWQEIRRVMPAGITLATVGVLLTAGLVALFAVYVLAFPWPQAMLLGAVVSSTDAAAVFAILRARGVRLRSNLQALIELESGSNDPMAILLTVGIISLITIPGETVADLVPTIFQQLAVGALAGYVAGRAMVATINRLHLAYDGLYPVVAIALVLVTYSATTLLGGNGFLAVYLAGIVLGNRSVIHRRSLMHFFDGMAWLMQIVMFLTLGLLVFPSQLLPVVGAGLMVSAFLMFVARPLSVFLTLLPFRMNRRKVLMVGWVGLRGAVPIILATFPLLANIDGANSIFNLVFFVVLTSILVQGSTIPFVARKLRVNAPEENRPRSPIFFEPTEHVRGDLVELDLPAASPGVGKRLVELGLPAGALLVLVGRNGVFFVPHGSTQLEAGDTLFFLAEARMLREVKVTLGVES